MNNFPVLRSLVVFFIFSCVASSLAIIYAKKAYGMPNDFWHSLAITMFITGVVGSGIPMAMLIGYKEKQVRGFGRVWTFLIAIASGLLFTLAIIKGGGRW